MIILLTGLPGVGKGTQADLLVDKYNIQHLSTGNVFRALMKEETELAKELNNYIKEGKLVPDELTIKILKQELQKEEYKNGFLLDGFPRTTNQAKALDDMLADEKLKLDYIINLHLSEIIIKERLIGRLFCPSCQTTYHKTLIPPKVEGVCDRCSSKLIIREDDKPEKILNRLEVAKEQTLPVIDYYGDNVNTIETENLNKNEVFSKILEVIND